MTFHYFFVFSFHCSLKTAAVSLLFGNFVLVPFGWFLKAPSRERKFWQARRFYREVLRPFYPKSQAISLQLVAEVRVPGRPLCCGSFAVVVRRRCSQFDYTVPEPVAGDPQVVGTVAVGTAKPVAVWCRESSE